MLQTQSKPAPLMTGTGFGMLQSLAACSSEIPPAVVEIQTNWIAIRFGLPTDRARLVAGLCFGERLPKLESGPWQ